MQRALAKRHVCVIGVDDGAFSRRQPFAPIAAVVVRTPMTVDAVRLDRVRVDGDDATTAVVRLVRATPGFDGVRAVLLDGVVVGGFNVVDLTALSRQLQRPVVALTRRPPDLSKIRSALRTYFPRSYRRRWSRVRAARLFPIATAGQPILGAAAGCTRAEARALVARCAVVGYWPEALRLAHLVAHAAGVAPGRSRTIKGRPSVIRPGL